MTSFTSTLSYPAFRLGPATTTSTSATFVPPANGFPVSIAGRGYMVDTEFQPYRREAFGHKSIPPQRQSLHFTNIPDDGTVSTEGLWRREARDWSLGAGQIYFDRKDSDPARFYRSKGINPWTQWKASLLNDTMQRLPDCYRAIRAGQYVYYITADQSAVKYRSSWSGADTTISGAVDGYPFPNGVPGAILDITSNGTYLYALTTFGIFQIPLGGNISSTNAHMLIEASCDSGFHVQVAFGTSNTSFVSDGTLPSPPTNPGYYYIQIGSEIMKVTSVSSTTVYVTRAQFGTTAASHSNGNVIYYSQWSNSGNSSNPFSGVIAWVGDKLMVALNNLAGWSTTYTGTPKVPGLLAGKPGSSLFDLSQIAFSSYPQPLPLSTSACSFYTHPDPNWVWNGITASGSQIYFSGYSSTSVTNNTTSGYLGNGSVMRSTVQQVSAGSATSTGVLATGILTVPVSALPLLAGEYPTCIKGYLNYIFVGTNKGIRMCQSLNTYDPTGGSGDLKAGPLIPNITQPVTLPVRAIVGNGRHIYFGWSKYDSSSSGIGRLDLSRFTSELAPAYASDLMITSQSEITNLAWCPFTDSPLISIGSSSPATTTVTDSSATGASTTLNVNSVANFSQTGFISVPASGGTLVFSYTSTVSTSGIFGPVVYFAGLTLVSGNSSWTIASGALVSVPSTAWTADVTKHVSSGTIDSGHITYGISDYKNAVSIDVNVDNAADATNSSVSCSIVADTESPASAGNPYYGLDGKYKFSFEQLFGEQYEITTTLTASSSGLSPVLNRMTLKALPGIPSGINIMVPVLLYDPTEVDGQARSFDPYAEYAFLEDLRQKQIVVQYVEGNFTADVTVDHLHWMPERRRNLYQGGYHGDLIVTLKTVTG